MGDLRVSAASQATSNQGSGRGGGRRGRGGRPGPESPEQRRVPATDFDFESSNAKFDKAAAAKVTVKSPTREDGVDDEGAEESVDDAPKAAYNPKASFFDSLSSSASALAERGANTEGRGARRAGGGNGGRTRRDEERERNVATFGEPGGVGLLGPGGYVGGWGGYSRRGGRPRRGGGGPRGGGNAQAAAARV